MNATTLESILVHVDASPQSALRLAVAGQLAAQHGAEVKVVYAVVPGTLHFPYSDGVGTELLQRIRPLDDERRVKARAMFDNAVADGLKGARWLDPIEDFTLRDFARRTFYSDLTVLGQRDPGSRGQSGVPVDFVESVLFDSGSPALIVPYIGARSTLGKTVMIAWKETRETARAVAAAMPLLRKAQRVHVTTWGDEQSPAQRRAPELIERLQRYGIEATLHRYGDDSGDIGASMLSAAADVDADLMVMGAYSRSRAREWVLGGATRTLLASMTIPLLMAR